MDQQERCIGCGKPTPPTDTDHTLISTLGWRITRKKTATGESVPEWRCPACWVAYKQVKGAAGGGDAGRRGAKG